MNFPLAQLSAFDLFTLGFSLLSLLYFAFWAWMLIHCIVYEPDKFFWLWLLVIVWFPGAIIYAVIRYFPASNWTAPRWVRTWTKGRELQRLEAATLQIGNAHQFVVYGDALREVGQWGPARAAYESALKKDPRLLPALWGAAQVEEARGNVAEAADLAQRVLAADPNYKFGDVSLVYGRCLMEKGQRDAAREHFAQHVRRWRHPEGIFRYAQLLKEAGDVEGAKSQLRDLARDLATCPTAIARKNGRWGSRGRQLLRQLGG